jgi:DNA-binding Lrp family transcriptional regulator
MPPRPRHQSLQSAAGGRTQGDRTCGDGIYILIQTQVGKAAQVATDILEIKGVQHAEAVTGPYDVIVRVQARNLDELGRLVVARVQAVDGITRTLTCPVVHL